MIRGLYTAASGMLAASYRQTAVSNNIANLNTYGYREETTRNNAFANLLVVEMAHEPSAWIAGVSGRAIGAVGTGTMTDVSRPSLAQGPLIPTNGPLDMAIQGDGFFVLQTPEGEVLTRDGHFTLDANGNLVSSQGYLVLGEDGPISVGTAPFAVSADGTITQAGAVAGRLRFVNYAAADLRRVGSTAFVPEAGAAGTPVTARVTQGSLEGPNSDPTFVMTEMVKVSGQFTASQKAFQAADATLSRVINEVARF